jgi:tetratricopeptide (TPR) repeat protein
MRKGLLRIALGWGIAICLVGGLYLANVHHRDTELLHAEYTHSLTTAEGVVEYVAPLPAALLHPALSRGLDAIERGDFESARAAYQEAIDANRNNYFAYHGLGTSFVYEGRYGEAETAFQKALDIQPTYAPSISSLGHIAAYRKDYRLAVRFFSEAVSIDPNYGLAYWGLCRDDYNLKNYQDSIANCARVSELLPNSPLAAKAQKYADAARDHLDKPSTE